MSDAVVCGFSDPAAEIAGLAWSLGGAEGGLLLAAGEVHAAAARITPGDDATELSLEAPIASCEARLEAAPASLPAEDGPQGVEAAAAVASFELSKGDASGAKKADGHLTRWSDDPAGGASVVRHLALPGADGSVLLVVSVRPKGGGEHSDELAGAWILGSAEPSPFGEALLSTEYDALERPTRAGLELWPAESDAPPARAAGTRLGGVEEERIAAALLDASVEGFRGIGTYVLWRG
jgi:hypothetical protein